MITVPYATTDPAAILSDVEALWAITVTNGSGVKTIEIAGTQATAWTWAALAGANGGIAPGVWTPTAIKLAGGAAPAFAAL